MSEVYLITKMDDNQDSLFYHIVFASRNLSSETDKLD